MGLDSRIAALMPSDLDGRLIHQHDGNVVLHRVHSATLLAFQTLGILAILEGLFASGTDQYFEQVLGNHDKSIVPNINSLRRYRGTEKTPHLNCFPHDGS